VQRPKSLVLAPTYPRRPGDGIPARVPGASPNVLTVPDVRRFRYFPSNSAQLADGAILEDLKARPVRWLQVLPFLFAETLALWRAIRRAALIARPCIPKLVNTLGRNLYRMRGAVSRGLIRAVINNAGALTTMNSKMRDTLIEFGADPAATHILPMGADLASIQALGPSADRQRGRILFVGRLVEKKGLAVLVEAMRSLPTSGVELVVVGDGPSRSELERLASDLPVRFLGALARRDLAVEYAAASVAVFPSLAPSKRWAPAARSLPQTSPAWARR
jgi:colanic acid/amylovoran biosynthesis glycosyltransferase